MNKGRFIAGTSAALGLLSVVAFVARPRAAAPPPAKAVIEAPTPPPAPELPGPVFVRFETPTPKVKIHPVGQGFEIINTDPGLTGTDLDFSGITDHGDKIPYHVKLPPPSPVASDG